MKVEQKFSSMNRQSLWSELPPEIIHHIFSFLPSTRQVAKTCLISKCWLHAWRSYFEGPSLIFIIGEVHVTYRKFCEFVDHTMSRFDNQRSCKMQKFVLDVPAFGNFDYLNKWINIAIDNNVEEMTLSEIRYSFRYLKRALNNESLRSLNLNLWTIPDETHSINLPNVVNLTLSMLVFNGKFLERFLKECPLLETITIGSCDPTSEIKVTGCDHLKTLTVNLRVDQGPKLVHIDAPNLETLLCKTIKTGVSNVLSINNCTKLKHLDLEFFTLDTEWFEGFLKQLASLETLKLKFENSLSSKKDLFSISNPSIKKLVLDQCISPSRHSFVIFNPPHDCIVHFRLMLDAGDHSFNWVGKLGKSISSFSNLRSLSLVYRGKEQEIGSWREDGNYNLPSTTVEIEFLKLTIDDAIDHSELFFSKFKNLLSGLFSICHPAILTIEASGKNNAHNKEITRKYLKLLAESVIIVDQDKEVVVECRICSNSMECWKHQLKEVKIKEDDEFILEQSSAVKITFMLKW